MAKRYLYYFRRRGGCQDVKNQIPAPTVWLHGRSAPTSITGVQKITFVIRSHGARGGTIAGTDALKFAKARLDQLSSSIRGRVDAIVFLVCHAGVSVNRNDEDVTLSGIDVWGPQNQLKNDGTRMYVRGNDTKTQVRDGVTRPASKLTSDNGWNTRSFD